MVHLAASSEASTMRVLKLIAFPHSLTDEANRLSFKPLSVACSIAICPQQFFAMPRSLNEGVFQNCQIIKYIIEFAKKRTSRALALGYTNTVTNSRRFAF
jgi:hypothetical protein